MFLNAHLLVGVWLFSVDKFIHFQHLVERDYSISICVNRVKNFCHLLSLFQLKYLSDDIGVHDSFQLEALWPSNVSKCSLQRCLFAVQFSLLLHISFGYFFSIMEHFCKPFSLKKYKSTKLIFSLYKIFLPQEENWNTKLFSCQYLL